MFIIGITGPTGAGKTTALKVLEELGGRVFDCDAVYHEMLDTDGALLGRIEAAFPGVVKDWALDRKALGARVYGDPAGLQRLTDITWPAVKKRVLEEIRQSEAASPSPVPASPSPVPASSSPVPCSPDETTDGRLPSLQDSPSPVPCSLFPVPLFAVIDAIGLFESGLADLCDLTVAVVADEEIRVRRLTARDGITEGYARARIAAQKSADWFAERADLVLENNGTEAEFEAACRAVFGRYLPPHGANTTEGDCAT